VKRFCGGVRVRGRVKRGSKSLGGYSREKEDLFGERRKDRSRSRSGGQKRKAIKGEGGGQSPGTALASSEGELTL